MARRVLLASTSADEMLDVKLLLQAEDCEVDIVESFDAMLREARTTKPDLLVVTEELPGGSGSELCALLDGDPGRPTILYVGDAVVRGADATVPDGNTVMISDTAQDLLQRRAPNVKAEPTEPGVDGDTLGWAVTSDPLKGVPAKGKAAPAAPPGDELLSALASESLESLLRRVRESDYFEILGVTPAAPLEEIRAAHAARLASLRDLSRESATGRAHLEEVRSALDEALDVLADPGLRAAYTRHRPVNPVLT